MIFKDRWWREDCGETRDRERELERRIRKGDMTDGKTALSDSKRN